MMFRAVFWVVLPCKMIVDRRFRGAYCLHHQGWMTIILHGSTTQKTVLNINYPVTEIHTGITRRSLRCSVGEENFQARLCLSFEVRLEARQLVCNPGFLLEHSFVAVRIDDIIGRHCCKNLNWGHCWRITILSNHSIVGIAFAFDNVVFYSYSATVI
jgi:hypothetical protein